MLRFRPPWWSILLLIFGVVLFGNLSWWQYQRGLAREALIESRTRAAAMAPFDWGRSTPAVVGRRYVVRGEWLTEQPLVHENQSYRGRPGYHLWSAMDVGDDQPLVLVNRGWVAAPPKREQLPDTSIAEPDAVAVGIWAALPQPGIRLEYDACADSAWPRRVFFPRQSELRCVFDRPVYPGVLLLDEKAPNGATRDWLAVGLPPERHYGYAIQWLALAVTSIVLFLILNTRREVDPS